jgi:hypothetical protein
MEEKSAAEKNTAESNNVVEKKNYIIDKKTGITILLMVITFGLIAIYFAYRTRLLNRLKRRMRRDIKGTNLSAYESTDRVQIKHLMERYIRRIDKAKNMVRVLELKDGFDDALEAFQTRASRLADEKMDAMAEAYETYLKKSLKSNAKEAAAAAKDGDLGRAARFAAAARSYASVILGRGGADAADLEDHVQKLRHAGSHESIQRLRKEYRRHR